MRKVIAILLLLVLVASTVVATIALTQPPKPDWTMADCSLWENSQTPVLPAYTYTDRCWDSTYNTIAYASPDVR